jgi:glycosyltransferase involved in cell wall biosynthesis
MFSIIIPTYNRSDILQHTIDAYLGQSATYLIDEIIIIDDGSDEKQRLKNEDIANAAKKKAEFPVKYLCQDNKGPAEARNKGIGIAQGEIILFTGDDIVPHRNMVKEHFFYHKKSDMMEHVCVLGYSVWPQEIAVTPFMLHIQENGLQFGYSIIPCENDVPFNFFYTSNVSLHREFLLKERQFDTDFPYAVWEDIELAYRLKKRGMIMVYNKNAIGYHYHPTTFASFRQRQERSGYAAYVFYKKYPELKKFLNMDKAGEYHPGAGLTNTVREWYCLLADRYSLSIHVRNYDKVLEQYYIRGIKKYLDEHNGS